MAAGSYAVATSFRQLHTVKQYRLLAYVGKISERSANRIAQRAQEVMAEFCEIHAG